MYLTLKELAKELKISPNTVRNQIKKGLPNIKMGRSYRFVLNDVVEWFKKGEQNEDKRIN